VSGPLQIEVSDLATRQIRAAEQWWRLNRPKAPNAIREDLERASSLISVQPEVGARATNVSLAGVRRLHLARVRHYVYYRVVTDPERVQLLAFWQTSRGSGPPL
jgi:ParE toxin of type II toxin-antitoxin system, parDE